MVLGAPDQVDIPCLMQDTRLCAGVEIFDNHDRTKTLLVHKVVGQYGSFSILNSNPPFFLCLNTSFVLTNYQPIQHNASYNRTVGIMHRLYNATRILYILVDWSLSGIMTSKHVIRESESPRPAASSILISRMTRSSVIIPYIILIIRKIKVYRASKSRICLA